MTQLAARATSMGASALVLGLLTLGALTMTFAPMADDDSDVPVIPIVVTPAPPPPPPPVDHRPRTREPVHVDALPQETTVLLDDLPRTADVGSVFIETEVEIADPRWVRRPHDLAIYYPRRAVQRNVEGSVTLDCMVSRVGALTCAVVSETPGGWGFGDAALRISRDHQMQPAMRDGVPTEGRYRMRIPFELN